MNFQNFPTQDEQKMIVEGDRLRRELIKEKIKLDQLRKLKIGVNDSKKWQTIIMQRMKVY